MIAARHKIDGGASVLFDAVAVLPSAEGAERLSTDAPSRDFVSDAFAHCKFIGFGKGASALFAAARLPEELDAGFVPLDDKGHVGGFVEQLSQLRFWAREMKVDLDAKSAAKPRKGK